MKLLLSIILFVSVTSGGATEAEGLIEHLPEVRSKSLADTAKQRAGSTTEMIDAAVTIRDRLLPLIVTLQSKMEKKSEEDVRAGIERDLEAISRDAVIRGHSEGWGGTAVAVDSAWAAVEHLEVRASWCVWQLMKDTEEFDFDAWLARWKADSYLKPEGGFKPQPESEGRSR